MDRIRWGIIGTGAIAKKFAEGLKVIDDAELTAVCSRSMSSAESFAHEYGIHQRHVGLDNFTADKNIDAVYVATPHPFHCEGTLACLDAGISVLCEKPFAMNSKEVKQMVDKAKEKKIFLMEAMWTFFFPAMAKVRKLISSGAIGEVRLLQSNFCFRAAFNPEGRLFKPELGGGALLDVGVYNMALAYMVFGKEPVEISSQATLGKTGVDEQSSIILKYDDGALATSICAIRTSTDHDAIIHGTDGFIKIPHHFWQPKQIIYKAGDKDETDIIFNHKGNGYNYEAEHVTKCLREEKIESSLIPWETSISIMKTMDEIRAQWGLKYPMEK